MAHILIVDEDDIAADLAAGMLAAAGHKCGQANGPAAAWQMLHWRRPDLLLLDEAMPGQAGATFLHSLRRSSDFHDLPVILLTADDDCVASSIGKPLHSARLLEKVARLLPSQAARLAEFEPHNRKDHAPRRVVF